MRGVSPCNILPSVGFLQEHVAMGWCKCIFGTPNGKLRATRPGVPRLFVNREKSSSIKPSRTHSGIFYSPYNALLVDVDNSLKHYM